MLRIPFIILTLLSGSVALGQSILLPLDHSYLEYRQAYVLNDNALFTHTSFKPALRERAEVNSFLNQKEQRFERKQYNSWVGRKFFNEHLIRLDTQELILNIDPIVHFETGQDQEDLVSTNYSKNIRGFRLDGNVGKGLYFQSSFYENQAIFPNWVDSSIQVTGVAPGSGRVKLFKENGFDYAMASGLISFDPWKFMNVQAGHGKHFIGEGYRSLLLSDNAFNYPFLRVSTDFGKGKLRLTNTWASLLSLVRIERFSTPEALFQRKAATFHHLSWQPLPWLGLGLFESVQWQRWDSTGSKPYNWAIPNPVPGGSTVIYGLNDVNNAVMGFEGKARIQKKYLAYFQYLIDGKDENGLQLGVKAFDFIGVQNLNLQIERNQISAYALNHEVSLQNYGHYYQALGHPLGAGFDENVLIANYRWRSWFVRGKLILANYGVENDSVSSGRNIFIPENNLIQSGNSSDVSLSIVDLQLGYVVNSKTNVRAFLGITQRRESGPWLDRKNSYVYLALRTSLTNVYYDF